VTYGNNTFVAVANTGTGNRVMTSPDGITWTSRTSAADNSWLGVTYGNNTFVAVANTGTGNRVMTSPNGITWTSRTSAANNQWRSVTYGNNTFVAVASTGINDRVMTSPDGITWTSRTSAANNSWYGVTYGNNTFVAVAGSGTGNRVMTSPNVVLPIELLSFTGTQTGNDNLLTWRTESELNNSHFDIERSTDGTTFRSIGQVKGDNKPSSYEFVDNQPFALTYYRLRQIDFDGTETLSKIVSVKRKDAINRVSIYPNPVSNTLTVEHAAGLSRADSEEGDFQILNLLGQQVLTGKTGQQLDVSALPQGTYILKVGVEQVTFLKQ
jgi:hypothetical protein